MTSGKAGGRAGRHLPGPAGIGRCFQLRTIYKPLIVGSGTGLRFCRLGEEVSWPSVTVGRLPSTATSTTTHADRAVGSTGLRAASPQRASQPASTIVALARTVSLS